MSRVPGLLLALPPAPPFCLLWVAGSGAVSAAWLVCPQGHHALVTPPQLSVGPSPWPALWPCPPARHTGLMWHIHPACPLSSALSLPPLLPQENSGFNTWLNVGHYFPDQEPPSRGGCPPLPAPTAVPAKVLNLASHRSALESMGSGLANLPLQPPSSGTVKTQPGAPGPCQPPCRSCSFLVRL